MFIPERAPGVRRDAHVPHRASKPLTVLVADTDADTREMYRLALVPGGYSVYEAIDGRDALAKVYGCRPDVIVADVRLGYVTGPELCRLLRSDPRTASIAIALLTADPTQESLSLMHNTGADAILVKPFTPDALLLELGRLHRERELASTNQWRGAEPNDRERSPGAPTTKVRAFERFVTTRPPVTPPTLHCPSCENMLQYVHSNVGGVSDRYAEQWDYYSCPGCGRFQYRHRTRKLRPVR